MRKSRISAPGLAINGLNIVLLIFFAGPLLWLLDTSLQFEPELVAIPPHWLPHNPTLDNYGYILTGEVPANYVGAAVGSRAASQALETLSGLQNSLIVATVTALLNIAMATATAFTLARVAFRLRGAFLGFVLLTRLVPPIALAIPYFVIFDQTGLLDTYAALILVYLGLSLPFTIWYLTLYFRNLPRDVEEAAMLDGCSRLGALVRVVVPVAAPGLAAAAVFAFMLSYSEFMFAVFLTKTEASHTAPVVLANIAINYDISYSLLAAAVVLTVLPTILIALVFRNYIRRGLALMGTG